MNLAVILDMKKRFNVPIGLSDHSFGSVAPTVAVALGARVIEKHVRLDEKVGSPDEEFSMRMSEFQEMVSSVRKAYTILGKQTYDLTENEKRGLRSRRSLYAVENIKAGEIFTKDNVKSIRPGYGLKPRYYERIVGKKAKQDYQYGDPISMDEIKEIR